MPGKRFNKNARTALTPEDKLFVCSDILRKQTDLMRQVETRANIVIGLSSTAVVFVVNSSGVVGHPLVLPTLIVTAFVSIIFALMAVKPPGYFTWKKQTQSVFYHTYIAKMPLEKYIQKLGGTLGNIDEAVRQYAIETHNLCEHSIYFKKRFAHIAISVFTLGLFATVLVWLV